MAELPKIKYANALLTDVHISMLKLQNLQFKSSTSSVLFIVECACPKEIPHRNPTLTIMVLICVGCAVLASCLITCFCIKLLNTGSVAGDNASDFNFAAHLDVAAAAAVPSERKMCNPSSHGTIEIQESKKVTISETEPQVESLYKSRYDPSESQEVVPEAQQGTGEPGSGTTAQSASYRRSGLQFNEPDASGDQQNCRQTIGVQKESHSRTRQSSIKIRSSNEEDRNCCFTRSTNVRASDLVREQGNMLKSCVKVSVCRCCQ